MRRTAAAVATLVAACSFVTAEAVPAARAATIAMGGEQVTEALVADLAYFYRHAVPDPPGLLLSGGGTNAGIATPCAA